MDGPSHYSEAERDASEFINFDLGSSDPADIAAAHAFAAQAQVHATLALAAAIALIVATEAEPPEGACAAWAAAIGAQPAPK